MFERLISAASNYQSQDILYFDKEKVANERKKKAYYQFPHLFVLCCLMDKQIDAGRAWNIPFEVCEFLNLWKVDELCAVSEQEYTELFNQKKLHRFNNGMPRVFKSAIMRIADNYHGNAAEIWNGNPSSASVVYRFLEFEGCGIKIATMATNLLHKGLGVTYSDYSSIDISPDVHVIRVMKRLGLIPYGQIKEKELATYKAREINPSYPGLIDGFFWFLGTEYCRPSSPRCKECPIKDICIKAL